MAAITTYRVHMYGQQREPGENAPYRTFTWMTRDSATTEIIGSGAPDKHSIIAWGPGHLYASTKQTTVLWMIRPQINSSLRGCGRLLNFHSTPALPGSWFWGNGVSPLALDFVTSPTADDKSGALYEGVSVTIEPTGTSTEQHSNHTYHYTVVPISQWNAAVSSQSWISITMQITWGHVDLPTAGAIKIFVNGNDTPVVNVSGICTHYLNSYGESGDGSVPPKPSGGQQGVTLWTGGYHINSNNNSTAELGSYDYTMPRVGNTPTQALQDGVNWPINEFTHTGQDSISTAGSTPSHTDIIGSLDSSAFQLPASLGGSGGGGGGGGGGGTPPPTGAPDLTGVVGFGDTSANVANAATASFGLNNKRVSQYTADKTRDITSIRVLQAGFGTSGVVNRRFFIANTDGTNPTSTLVTCSPVSIAYNDPLAWYTIPLPTTFRWDVGVPYFVGFQTDAGTGDAIVTGYTISGAGEKFRFASDTYSDGLSNPFGAVADSQTLRMVFFFEGAEVIGGGGGGGGGTGSPNNRLTTISRTPGAVRIVNPAGRVQGIGGGGL